MRYFLLIFSLTLILGCKNDIVFQSSVQTENGWNYSDSLQIDIPIDSENDVYDLLLNIEHSVDYPYQNIYIEVDATFPDGTMNRQEKSIDLANNAGAWYSKCNSKTCSGLIPIEQKVFFNQKGTYHFVLKQFMRVENLDAVSKIGLALRKLEIEKE